MNNQPLPSAALLSVTDRSGIVGLANAISKSNRLLVSTGGTAESLRAAHFEVTDVSEITGFPSVMDGRLKTLHPKVFGGILYDRDILQHVSDARDIEIQLGYDIVVVNLYDFNGMPSIEKIDIGGASLIRAAAKNFKFVTVVTHPKQYPAVISELQRFGHTTLKTRLKLAKEAFDLTQQYDAAIANWFMQQGDKLI